MVPWDARRIRPAALSLVVEPNLHIVKERLGPEDIRTTINRYGRLLPSVGESLALPEWNVAVPTWRKRSSDIRISPMHG